MQAASVAYIELPVHKKESMALSQQALEEEIAQAAKSSYGDYSSASYQTKSAVLFTINRHITQYLQWVVSFNNTSLIVLFFKMNKCPIIPLASMEAGVSINRCAYSRTTDDCFCVTGNSGSN